MLEEKCVVLADSNAKLAAKTADLEVQIYKDFTPEVLEQRAKYRDIKSKLYNLGLRPALLFPARLQIKLGNGAKQRFPSPLEAVAFAAGYEREPAN
ncbi:hypothetical protein KUCAC02_025238 [Chaenocephalus aceratus]|nr:hypothetical protein KUCAC02_025238 [Chaenocephalus aceratus]